MKNNLEEASKFNWRVPKVYKEIEISIIKCSNCGYDIETFSDEKDIKCSKCKKDINKEKSKTINKHKVSGY